MTRASDPDEELSLLLALEQQVRALISLPTPDLRLRSVSEITLAALDALRLFGRAEAFLDIAKDVTEFLGEDE